MSSSDVSSVTSHFSVAAEGFITTTGGSISSGAVTVPLNSTSGLTNGNVFVGLIEPGTSGKEQTFTGIVDTSGSQITGVVWTRGSNTAHAAGVSVVDYVTGTAHNMMTKGFLVEHSQDGTHGNITPDSIITPTLTVTSGTTLPAGDIVTADIAAGAVTDTKLIYGKVRTRQGGSATNWSTAGTTAYDYSATNTFMQTGTRAITTDNFVITFPTAYSQIPNVVATVSTAAGANAWVEITTRSATTFTCRVVNQTAVQTTEEITWIAVGE